MGPPRSTHRHRAQVGSDEDQLVRDVVILAARYGRYRHRRITALVRQYGRRVSHKRVERIQRQEGLKVPKRQPRRGRLWLHDGSRVHHRAGYRNHVWSYDFETDRTHDGRALKLLTIVDEYTRECLAIAVRRRMRSIDVLDQQSRLFLERGTPAFLRSGNGPELPARLLRDWLQALGVTTLFIEPGSPWKNGYVESFNGKLRDELLDREIL
jgi:transposase InsO family protein